MGISIRQYFIPCPAGRHSRHGEWLSAWRLFIGCELFLKKFFMIHSFSFDLCARLSACLPDWPPTLIDSDNIHLSQPYKNMFRWCMHRQGQNPSLPPRVVINKPWEWEKYSKASFNIQATTQTTWSQVAHRQILSANWKIKSLQVA